MTRRSIALASLVLAVLLAVVPAAVAGKPETRAGGSTGAKITFTPSPATSGSQYTVNGSGFRPNTWISVGAHFADTTWWNSKVTDSSGNFSLTFTATSSGQVMHEAKEMGNNGRLRLRTTATLTVNPAS
jgi:hypothetical protein